MKEKIESFLTDLKSTYSYAYKYAEFDFFKLKDEIVNLLRSADSKGYNNPECGFIEIEVIDSIQTIVCIDFYFKKTDKKVQRFSRKLDIGMLTLIPEIIKEKITNERKVRIELDMSDMHSIYMVSSKVIIPTDTFINLVHFKFKNEEKIPVYKELSIKDELFYYTIDATCYYDTKHNIKETKRRYVGYIKNIPADVLLKINDNPDRKITLDVTPSDSEF